MQSDIQVRIGDLRRTQKQVSYIKSSTIRDGILQIWFIL